MDIGLYICNTSIGSAVMDIGLYICNTSIGSAVVDIGLYSISDIQYMHTCIGSPVLDVGGFVLSIVYGTEYCKLRQSIGEHWYNCGHFHVLGYTEGSLKFISVARLFQAQVFDLK